MKKVIVRKTFDSVYLEDLDKWIPIFAKKAGKLFGMIVLENDQTEKPKGWILRTGKDYGAYGFSDTLEKCIQRGMDHGYEFFVED